MSSAPADLPTGRVLPVGARAPPRASHAGSAEVDPLDPEVVALAADLLATQRAAPGCVGLAAPQVGVAVRVFALDVTGHPRARTCHGPLVLANPVVESASRVGEGQGGMPVGARPHRRRETGHPAGRLGACSRARGSRSS